MIHYQLVDDGQLFQELPGLAPGAMDIEDLKDQGQGGEIINKLAIDGPVELPGLQIIDGYSRQGACLARRIVSELGRPPLACIAVDIGPSQCPGYELFEGFGAVFFSAALVILSLSQASMISSFTLLGSLIFISRVQDTSWPVIGDFTSFQPTTM